MAVGVGGGGRGAAPHGPYRTGSGGLVARQAGVEVTPLAGVPAELAGIFDPGVPH